VRAGQRINQLPRDANFACCLAHRPLKDIAHAKPASDLLHIDGFAFERKARIASDHEQPLETRERGDDFLDHAIRKVFLFWIAAHVLERQDRDRRLIGQRRRAFSLSNTRRSGLSCFTRLTYLVGPNWLLNVLHLLNTKVHKGHRQDLAYLIVCRARDADASGLCAGL
jgi:hypothetical protein